MTPSDRRSDLLRVASLASPVVAFALLTLKFWGWQQTSAVSLLASLADSLLDLLASLITLLAIRVALTPADDRHRFGHGKSEAVAGLMQAVLIAVSAMFVVTEAVSRLTGPVKLVQAPSTGIAVMAVSGALTLVLVLFQRWAARRTGSFALAADLAHYQTDLLLMVLVVAGTLAGASPQWRWGDPLVALIAAAYLVHTASGLVREALRVLLDEEFTRDERERLRTLILAHAEVQGVHDLRTRSAGHQRFIQVHLELDPAFTLEQAHGISDEIEAKVRREFSGADVFIHLDPAGVERAHGYR